MSEPRLIKKYSNRRLYDTAASRYVNLDQVASLVRRGHPLKVLDAKTGEDLTRQVLTQIIVEDARQADGGAPVEFLRDMIRATDRAQRDFFEWYLATAAEAYKRLQKSWGDRIGLPTAAPQLEAWSRLWDPVKAFQSFAAKSAGRRGDTTPDSVVVETTSDDDDEREVASNSSERELADLRTRLEALERKLAGGRD